jgi:hypothetical protein
LSSSSECACSPIGPRSFTIPSHGPLGPSYNLAVASDRTGVSAKGFVCPTKESRNST